MDWLTATVILVSVFMLGMFWVIVTVAKYKAPEIDSDIKKSIIAYMGSMKGAIDDARKKGIDPEDFKGFFDGDDWKKGK